jgi:cation:H+ antiporter
MLEGLGLLPNVAILIAALAALTKASDLTITHSINVASVTGLGKTTVGFILVALSTSLPELFVAIFSVLNPDNVGVSIGNVLGSNIVNICLILGVCFLLISLKYPEKTRVLPQMAKEELGSLYFGLFIASIVPLTLIYIGYASRFVGVMLLAFFIYYLFQLSKSRTPTEQSLSKTEKSKLNKYVAFTILGAVGVIICAKVVAFGTSVPELSTSIDAVKKGHLELALGNIIGSCFMNITLILGITLVASTLTINMSAFSNVAIFSLITNLLLWYFLSNERVGRREGMVLLFLYALFIAISLGWIQIAQTA